MSGIPAIPPAGAGVDAVSDIARRRAQGWREFGQLFAPPTETWICELRSGDVRQRLEVAIGWRAGELKDFGPPMLMLGAFERSSRRRPLERDVENLSVAFGRIAGDEIVESAQVACVLLHGLGADEAVAWAAGRLPRARDLRLQQDRELRGEVGEILLEACASLLGRRLRQPYVALAQVCRLWVDRERAGSSFADAL